MFKKPASVQLNMCANLETFQHLIPDQSCAEKVSPGLQRFLPLDPDLSFHIVLEHCVRVELQFIAVAAHEEKRVAELDGGRGKEVVGEPGVVSGPIAIDTKIVFIRHLTLTYILVNPTATLSMSNKKTLIYTSHSQRLCWKSNPLARTSATSQKY